MSALQEFHESLGAQFLELGGVQAVAHYGDVAAEHHAICEAAGVIDLSGRSRLCLTGGDRIRFLNGQVTNDVKVLQPGNGCYAALVSAKGRVESDFNIWRLEDEILLDFEPGLTERVMERFEKYVIADDVEVHDVASLYSLLSVQGPKSGDVVQSILGDIKLPESGFVKWSDASLGDLYCMNLPRVGLPGFDLFIPADAMAAVTDKAIAAAKQVGGLPCGFEALDMHRVEAGIPRFGVDMDESNLAPETGIESRAISYAKGCYIGQEVIARIRTYGQVKKTLCRFDLSDDLETIPAAGTKLFVGDREVGYLTSAVDSLRWKKKIALGYAGRDYMEPGTRLVARGEGEFEVVVAPF